MPEVNMCTCGTDWMGEIDFPVFVYCSNCVVGQVTGEPDLARVSTLTGPKESYIVRRENLELVLKYLSVEVPNPGPKPSA